MSESQAQEPSLASFLFGNVLKGAAVGFGASLATPPVSNLRRDLIISSFFIEDFIDAGETEICLLANKVVRYQETHGNFHKDKDIDERYEEVLAWLINLQRICQSEYRLKGVQGAMAALQRHGIKASFEVSSTTAENLYLQEKGKFNWSALFKYIATGFVSIAIFVFGVYIYLKYDEKRQGITNTVEM